MKNCSVNGTFIFLIFSISRGSSLKVWRYSCMTFVLTYAQEDTKYIQDPNLIKTDQKKSPRKHLIIKLKGLWARVVSLILCKELNHLKQISFYPCAPLRHTTSHLFLYSCSNPWAPESTRHKHLSSKQQHQPQIPSHLNICMIRWFNVFPIFLNVQTIPICENATALDNGIVHMF